MNNKHLSWYKEINNNFIIASRAYFLHQQRLQEEGCVVDIKDPSVSLACWSFSFIAIDFFMAYTYSFDYEIMQLPDTGAMPCELSNVTM